MNVSDALDIRLGATGVLAVYVGANKVWPLGGGGFAPFDVGWHCAVWADDPGWSNPGDGNAVASWTDGTGNGRSPAQTYGPWQPIFRASVADFNGHAAVEFDGINDFLMSAAFTSQANPTFVWIGRRNSDGSTGGYPRLVDGTGGGGPYTGLFVNEVTHKYSTYSGGFHDSTQTTDFNPHAIRLRTTSGAGSEFNVDGSASTYTAGGSDVTNSFGLSLLSNFVDMHVAFAGIYVGDVTTDPNWSAFVAGVDSYYGLTIG